MPFPAALAVAYAVAAFAHSGQVPADRTVLRAVRVDLATAARPTVLIEADGPLPLPHVGVLDGPPRIYLDFAGVTPSTRGAAVEQNGVLVRRVRVGVFQADPVITRVVIDLLAAAPHRLDARQREQGRVTVMVGSMVSSAGPPAKSPTLPATSAPAAKQARQPVKPAVKTPAPSSTQRAAERDQAVALAALEQLERLRPLLAAIDSRTDMPEASLRGGVSEFDTIKLSVAAIRSDRTREALTKICVLGTTAATTRIDAQLRSDAAAAWNAASAAAGALILLDHARSDLRAAPGSSG